MTWRGKGPQIVPEAAKSFPRWTLDAPKILFWPFQKKKEQPFPAQTALLSRTCRPRRPGRPPEPRNHGFRTPRGSKFDSPGAPFSTPGNQFFDVMRRTFPRKWGNTVPTHFSILTSISHPPLSPPHPHATAPDTASQEGPAECAKRLN